MSSKSIQSVYARARKDGYRAAESMFIARALSEFTELESRGLVRIRAEHERDDYFSVYGKPSGYTSGNGRRVSAEQEREEICQHIDSLGCWIVIAEFSHDDGETWEWADSIGMCTGYQNPCSPFENCYVPELMREAVASVRKFWNEDQQGEH